MHYSIETKLSEFHFSFVVRSGRTCFGNGCLVLIRNLPLLIDEVPNTDQHFVRSHTHLLSKVCSLPLLEDPGALWQYAQEKENMFIGNVPVDA